MKIYTGFEITKSDICTFAVKYVMSQVHFSSFPSLLTSFFLACCAILPTSFGGDD